MWPINIRDLFVMTRLVPFARKLHRWLSYAVFLQVTLWVVGGLTFAVIPFDTIIKGGAVIASPPTPTIMPAELTQLGMQLPSDTPLDHFAVHSSSQGAIAEVHTMQGTKWLRLVDGELVIPPLAEDITRFALTLYRGDAALLGARYLATSERRYLGLVDETYGQGDVWQVEFDDSLNTRLYFEGATGRYLTVRNDAWVFYDAMWRLHIMDYSDGDDFNNTLLRVLTPLALLFVLSGILLTWTAAKRAVRNRR